MLDSDQNSGLDRNETSTAVPADEFRSADTNGDGHIDLFVPQSGKAKFFKNDGTGRFTDVSDKCGDLGKPIAGATSCNSRS